MSQKVVDILRGISQAAAGMYDGALDELKLDSREKRVTPILTRGLSTAAR